MTYIEKAAQFGFKVVPRAEIFDRPQIQCYEGTLGKTQVELKEMHDEQDTQLRKRVEKYEGAHVVFTPDGDYEDFVLVGDDPEELAREAYMRECEIMGREP